MENSQPIPAIYYMRDNHTFKRLSENVDEALVQIKEEIEAGYSSGALCSKRQNAPEMLHCHYHRKDEFFASVRSWYESINPTAVAVDHA